MLSKHHIFVIFINLQQVANLEYTSDMTILFQRLSVIVIDLFQFYISYLICSSISVRPSIVYTKFLLLSLNCGLLLVDNIHFQYNGLLICLLLFILYSSIQGNDYMVTALYSILVLMKHLFAPMAPLLAVYLLSRSFHHKHGWLHTLRIWFVHIVIVVTALTVAFLPFYLSTGIAGLEQIFQRLFPFQRGLVHAYWAPNIWALYCCLDKIIIYTVQFLQLHTNQGEKGSFVSTYSVLNSTSGIVGEFGFVYLPQISALFCMLLIGICLIPACILLYKYPSGKALCKCMVYSSMSMFMFGYHVHEKAILIPWVLQTLVCTDSIEDRLLYLLLACSGTVSLFPLIPGQFEWAIKGKYPEFCMQKSFLNKK